MVHWLLFCDVIQLAIFLSEEGLAFFVHFLFNQIDVERANGEHMRPPVLDVISALSVHFE